MSEKKKKFHNQYFQVIIITHFEIMKLSRTIEMIISTQDGDFFDEIANCCFVRNASNRCYI